MNPVRQIASGPAWILFLAMGLTVACQSSLPRPAPSEAAAGSTSSKQADESVAGKVTIHVTSNGWHTEIVVPRAALPADAIPEAVDFGDARYLSFGWGDAEYYQAPRPTFTMAFRAAMQPTPAVLHLAGLGSHPSKAYPGEEVLEFELTASDFRNLVRYLDAAFQRTDGQAAKPVAPGLYSFSRFYPATGEFHLFNTCNSWTARALDAAGLALDVAQSQSAEDLMSQLRDR